MKGKARRIKELLELHGHTNVRVWWDVMKQGWMYTSDQRQNAAWLDRNDNAAKRVVKLRHSLLEKKVKANV